MIFQKELIKSLILHSKRIAIETAENSISYADLFKISNQISHFLLEEKLSKETLIGIQLSDKSNLICSMIGVMNAGCVFVPIDENLPENRLKSIIEDLNLNYIISSKESKKNKIETSKYFFFEDILSETKELNVDDIKYPEYNKNDSLYIYFTSGSTGKPKGIVGKNCSLIQFVNWEIDEFNIDNTFRVSQFISPYFDAFLRDVFVSLIAGATICIPPALEDFYTADKITAWIDETKINLIHCVPSVFRVINNVTLKSENFENLKCILLSGEKIIPAELKSWYNIFESRIQLVNLYGTTETTMIRSFYKISPKDILQSKISIGTPIDSTEFLISKSDLKPCSMLIPGEIYIVSPYTSKGYLNAPELTHEKFLKIDQGTSEERIAFKTGDNARLLANGTIDLLGREDRQIKLRGIRIELDEIENALIQFKYIKNVIVVKNDESQENESLVAFIIKSEDFHDSELKKHLENQLPDYMIPSKIVEVKEFPLLSNGKINIKELLNSLIPKAIVAPTNETEIKILAIWRGILGNKPISIDESFHSLGGNSLTIMSLIGKIYKEFGIRISLSEIFKNFTIKKQAEFINRSKKDSLFVIKSSIEKPAYNLSAVQERIYYNYQINKDSTAYNLPMAWEINGEFNKNKLEEVLTLLVNRHESLRTQFIFENDRILQEIKDDVKLEIEEISIKDNNIQDSILNFIRPFNLNNAPLIRCGIIQVSENSKILVTDIHHIVCDGISQINLFNDFLSLYNGQELYPIQIQYKDFAEWETNFKTTEEYILHREFWLNNFDGEIPKLELPTINKDINSISDEGGSVKFSINREKINIIIEFLKSEEITTFSGLVSIFYIYLSQLTGQEDIVIGINSSGRMQDELEGLVGMFVKTLPIRFLIDTNLHFKDFAVGVHKYLIQANSKQIYDLSDILSELNRSRNTPVKSLFDAMFIFQNFDQKKVQTDNEVFSNYEFENTSIKYPISLFASESEESFNFRLEYSSMYFTKPDIEVLIKQFKSLVDDISVNPEAKIMEYYTEDKSAPQLIEDNITFNL